MEFIFNLLQLIGGLLLSVGYIPQIKKAVETKSMKDFSFSYLLAVVAGVGCMEAYAIHNVLKGVAMMFFVTNTMAFLLAVIMLVLYLIFENNDNKR